VTTAEIMELVAEYGREKYRAGKAAIRKEAARSQRAARRNIDKGKAHADRAIALKAQIEKAISEGPYL
jgi:N-methylhydantoinase B/oxoprolinase/acetone carboxylase alpha subunit